MKKLSIDQRLQILENKDVIKDLTHQYALYVNQGWNGLEIDPEALRNILTEDATWESTFMDIKVCGVENIIKSLKEETKNVLFSMHSYSNPVIKIDDNRASANWLFWVVSKFEKDATNQVFMSQDIDYINDPKGWRINAIRLHFGTIVKNN